MRMVDFDLRSRVFDSLNVFLTSVSLSIPMIGNSFCFFFSADSYFFCSLILLSTFFILNFFLISLIFLYFLVAGDSSPEEFPDSPLSEKTISPSLTPCLSNSSRFFSLSSSFYFISFCNPFKKYSNSSMPFFASKASMSSCSSTPCLWSEDSSLGPAGKILGLGLEKSFCMRT